MPPQIVKNYAVQMNYDDKWETEYYVDLYSNAYKVALLFHFSVNVRIKDMRTRKVVWES